MDTATPDAAALRAQLKKLSFAATRLTMDLHDLAEDLPTGWETIPDVARQTHDCYAKIDELRRQLAELDA